MFSSKEIYVDLKEKYDKVQKLILEDSKQDPAAEPYKSKYAAKVILEGMQTQLDQLQLNENDDKYKLDTMYSVVLLNLGLICVETEELSAGEKFLTSCVSKLEGNHLKDDAILMTTNALNQLGILWSLRTKASKSKIYLDKAEQYYLDYKQTESKPINITDIFSSDATTSEEGLLCLEKTYTLTLYYLAQVYGTLNEDLKSSLYCHVTLKRQLEFNDYESIDWALNAATLSQYFTEKNGFKQARHHLAAASCILDKYESVLENQVTDDETKAANLEQFKHRSADVARCWSKYGLCLLSNSWERLMNHADDPEDSPACNLSSDLSALVLKDDSNISKQLQNFTFENLDLSHYEKQISCDFVLTFDDAKLVFLTTQNWLNCAKEYYTLENLASEYAQIIMDYSQLFKYLALFEEDEDRQCKMHKRRIDQMEELVKNLNPQYYLQVCQQFWHELALAYSTILDIKLEKLKTQDKPTPHALIKINSLIDKSIGHFQSLLESVKHPIKKEFPETFSENVELFAVPSFFLVARLYNKYITPDKLAQMENTKKSLEYYEFVVKYCEKHPECAKRLSVELEVSKELVNLLPLKIQKLAGEIVH
ncbi:KIF1-binding protein homolog [Ctenocephalides felis]|uniref:KIF1-binding protein homolog n=1 Tax=Ctenocephalides felis TaxID=7515 RepID=UPI000E6E3835|nr:KIF1-binding protein homolog [Ctenocephalides felis]